MPLTKANINKSYKIDEIDTNTQDIKAFLFSLGCFPGEEITLISKLSSNYIVNIKNARYSIDKELAEAISLQ